MNSSLCRIGTVRAVTSVLAISLLPGKPVFADTPAVTLIGQTSLPDFSVYPAGSLIPLQFSVRGAANVTPPLILHVKICDEHDKSLAEQDLTVQDTGGGWSTNIFGPSDHLGFYRVYAALSNGVTLPAQGSRKGGFLTYAVVQDPATRVSYPPDEARFGMQGGFNGSVDSPPYLGIHWVNGPGAWKGNEPDQGGEYAQKRAREVRNPPQVPGATRGYDWSFVTKNGVKTGWPIYPIFYLYKPPDWATIPATRFGGSGALQPAARDAWDKYCRAFGSSVAQDYPELTQHLYQITWEPNWFNGSQEEFVEIYKIAYAALHAVDPAAVVAGPTKSGVGDYNMDQEEGWFKLGLGNLLDGYTLHPYTKMPAEANDYVEKLRGVNSFVVRSAGRALPLYSTEQGFRTNEDTSLELNQARYLVRSSLITLGEGYRFYVGFYLHDYAGEPGFGYFYNLRDDKAFGSGQLAPKPIMPAFAAETSLIDGHQTVGPLSLPGASQLGYAFQRGPEVVLALWDSGDASSTLGLATGAKSVDVFDWMGNRRTVPTPGGTLDLTLTQEPVYVRGVAPALYGSEAVHSLTVSQGPFSVAAGGSLIIPGTLSAPKTSGIKDVALEAQGLGGLAGTSPVWAGAVPGGASKSFQLALPVPPATPPGDYWVLVSAKGAGVNLDRQRVSVTVQPPIRLNAIAPAAGASNSLRISLATGATSPLAATLTIDAPTLGLKAVTQTVNLTPGSDQNVLVPCPGSVVSTETYPVTVTAAAGTDVGVERKVKVDFLCAPRLAKPLQISDDPTTWRQLPAFTVAGADRLVRSRQNYQGPSDLSAQVHLGWDDSALYLLADVTDDVQVQDETGLDIWKGDSLQLALNLDPGKTEISTGDMVNDTLAKTRYSEITFALTKTGSEAVRSVSFNPTLFPLGDAAAGLPVNITRDGTITTYRAVIPWKTLGEIPVARHGDQIGFALALNDRDSADEVAPKIMCLFGGIYPIKDADQLGTLSLQH